MSVVLPVAVAHSLLEVAVSPDTSMSGTPGSPMRACATVDDAVPLPGARVVVTLGQSFCTDSKGELYSAEHGVSAVVASAVRRIPVSGCGSTSSNGRPRETRCAEMPQARPVAYWSFSCAEVSEAK
ncbi:hypothetical protein OG390_02615 [Streptomyces sp. NBC_00996]|nr:hypothetical protein OG390_02615 [Streptomyces sp. NBC_00996]